MLLKTGLAARNNARSDTGTIQKPAPLHSDPQSHIFLRFSSLLSWPDLRRLDLFGSFTVTLHFRVRLPTFAQMYADPAFFPVTFPEAETDATDFLEELHFTFFLLPDTFSGVEAPR